MELTGTGYKPRNARYVYEKTVRLRASHRGRFEESPEGTVRDVSLTGVALNISTNVANGQFVEMHIEGVGSISGSVARTYNGGAAVHFDDDEETRRRVAETIGSLNRLA